MIPPKDLILSIRGDSTPYHDDPPNAGEFYRKRQLIHALS